MSVKVRSGFREQRSVRSNASRRHPSICTPGSELHRLCRSGDLSAIKSYLNETVVDMVINRVAGLNGCTPLHEAAMAGQGDVVRLLHEECETLDLNVRTQRGPASTPLHLASERGHVECVMALIECGASLEAVDRRFRTAKDVATENGKRQVAHVISLAELEKLIGDGDLGRIKEVLQSLRGHGKLLNLVAEWHQMKLNASLKKACMLGSYKMAIMIIRMGANNFAQCIKECAQKNRLNHILAYLRLCQAAYEDDQTAVDILLESNEDKISQHPRYASLVDFNTILLPLIDNGTLTITEPLHVALKARHVTTAGKILLCSSKQRSSGMVDWHGLELTDLETSWLDSMECSSMQLLCLSFNSLTQIPSQICHLRNLVKLQVAFNKLTYVPSSIFQIPCLENIDLSYNSISTLPEALLGKVSPSLHTLTLSNNTLSKFPEYFVGSELRCLDLSKNRFKVVPESVYCIKQLESLNMSNNGEIRFIPYELGGLKHLKVTSFDGLPYTFNVPNDSLMDFIKKRFKSMQTVSHFEVALMGFIHYSKTLHHFHSSLMRTSSLDCSVLKFDSPTHFLSLHHVFKLPNTLYVLLWDCHMRQDPNDLHRVLRHLSIHVPEAPVVVAACWKDFNSQLGAEMEELVKTSLWKDLREGVHLQHLVLEEDEDWEDVADLHQEARPHSFQALLKTISVLSVSVKSTQFVPGSYYSCGQTLAKKKLQFESEVKCPMLSDDEFWEEISKMPSHDLSNKEELCKLVSYLHLVGKVLKVQGPTGSQSRYVFNRQWFCNILGNILSRQGTQVVQSVSGVVHQEVLVDLLACPSFILPLPNALQYMLNKEGIALALSSEKWLIPSMLAESADDSTNIEPDQYGIRRQYTFNLTPANLWPRLIAHLLMNMDKFVREVSNVEISSSSSSSSSSGLLRFNTLPRQGVVDWSYWERGMLCWQNACHLVYSIESLSTSTDPYRETIEIRVPNNLIGYRTMHRLSLIMDSLLKNWYPKVWGSVEIWVPCSYCIHTGVPDVPVISFRDCVLAVSKGVGVKCLKHPEKITSITKIIPDLIQEDVSIDVFLPPGSVELNTSDTSTCISPPPTETVFKGTYNRHLVAVKPFPHRKMHGVSDEQTLLDQECPPLLQMWAEFEIFRHFQAAKSPFIIEVIGVCPDPLCLVFPFARWSSLDDVFHTKDVTISHIVRMKMIFQLASALHVLQSYKIIHRNICLANLLVFSLSADDAVNIKLAGFSNACHSIFQGIAVGQYGAYPAPEMLLTTEGEYDERVDIFAFAFVAYEIITQSRMHVTSSVSLQDSKHISRPSLEPVRIRAPYLVLLISECWHPDRTKRPFASKVVQLLKQPLHVLTRDGQLIHRHHEFFASSARFTRVHNNFHSDLFVSSGQLMGERTSCLACESLPGLSFEKSKQLPSEFVICMGCIGSQLWVSFYGKTVRVYSAINMEFINEFVFNYHVVAIAISPTSVYLGLENGVLQIYNVTDSVPTEPSLTKTLSGDEFKCIEAMEDSLVCATKNTIFCLHPDTLDVEEKWVLEFEAKNEIRSIAISQCNWNASDSKEEGSDLMWVTFRRWEQILVMNPHTGQRYYCIDCSRVLGKPPEKVYAQSMRVVLDTVWVGLNTGHILVFASDYREPRLLTHLKVHREGVRQLLLLHPSYMGPTTVLSTTEITRSLRDPKSSLLVDQQRVNFPDSVLVVSFGNGLDNPLYSVDKHGGVVRSTEEDAEASQNGLFAVILEGGNISRMVQIERNSNRSALPYMEDYSIVDDEDGLYALPPDASGSGFYNTLGNIPRNDTWSANTVLSPVHSNPKTENGNHYATIPSRGYIDSLSLSITVSPDDTVHAAKCHSPPPPLPPRDMPPSPGMGATLTPDSAKGNNPKSPLSSIFNSFKKGNRSPFPSNGVATHTEAKTMTDHETTPPILELSDDYEYPYQQIPNLRAQSYTLPNFGTKQSPHPRRLTYDETSRPEIEDSAEGFDPYVRMDTLMNTPEANLRMSASKANKKAMAIKQQRRNELCGVPEEDDFESREDFLGGHGVSNIEARLVRELDLAKPVKKVKPKVAQKPFKRGTGLIRPVDNTTAGNHQTAPLREVHPVSHITHSSDPVPVTPVGDHVPMQAPTALGDSVPMGVPTALGDSVPMGAPTALGDHVPTNGELIEVVEEDPYVSVQRKH